MSNSQYKLATDVLGELNKATTGMTAEMIATKLNVSTAKVVRILKLLHRAGMVGR